MFNFLKRLLTENIGLKIVALILTLALWFYVVSELNKGSEEERQFLAKVLPSEGIMAKKVSIKPIFVGHPHRGYSIDVKKAVVVPDYCIIVGPRDLLGKVRFGYTTPIDVSDSYKTFSKSVPLNPIAPGVYMEETLVLVTVPIEKTNP